MKNIAIFFIIIGIVISLFSNLLVFKPLKKYINHENLKKNDEDITILINMTKKIIYIVCIIFIIIGAIVYSFF